MNKDYTFSASDREKLRITTYLDKSLFFGKTLVFVHGFKGFKDWGFGPYLGEYLANKGFFVITFNFSHNGVGENKTEFTELEKFAKNTFSREIKELNEIISAFRNDFFEVKGNTPLGLIGHSRGGAIVLLTASKRNDVDSIVTWAAISRLDRYSKRQNQEWRKKGFFEILNTRTNKMMRLDIELLNDIENNSNSSLNIENAVKNLNIPLLIAHGEQDLAVPIAEAEQLYKWSDKSRTEFYKLFSTGHTFDIVHPFNGTSEKFDKLLDKTTNFFVNHLN
ncbi:MAG: alpha/beta fold hydrolase [Ignavibacteriales bacterium]|nr:MAG: alpha/beta fold hydrolase [Ignavibacteriales bacterium]